MTEYKGTSLNTCGCSLVQGVSSIKLTPLVPSPKFTKQLRKLDRHTQKLLVSWLNKNIQNTNNPRNYGGPLEANRSGQWKYRIGDYRVLVNIKDNELIVLALDVGHRREVYK